MNVLWITFSTFPEVSNRLKLKTNSKGWVYASANALLEKYDSINLAVVSPYSGTKFKKLELNNISFFLIPAKFKYKLSSEGELLWENIKEEFNPDIIHIHGSEFLHSFSFVKKCGPEKVVLSIQGLVSIYERYFYGNIRTLDLIRYTTPRDLVRFDTFFSKHKKMYKRGIYEKLLLHMLNHVIGRTSWDRDHAWAINQNLTYHFCNETLRPAFYENSWSIKNIERYSIFVSQAQYPIKGFHQLVMALPIVLKHYIKVKIYVAGTNFFSNNGIRINGYGNYINSLIKKFRLESIIEFTGFLTETEMCQRFLNSHITVCPSAIENSPNSIGEAQLLGVPCIASYVGGNPDMIKHGETGLLYRFEEVEMLAANICKLFSDDKLAIKISERAKDCAEKRHNKELNATQLYHIYSKIIDQN